MKTTLNFDDRLIRKAKRRAADEGETLTRLIEKAIRNYLLPAPRRAAEFKLDLLTKPSNPVPGVDWDDRDSIYEKMEGRS